MKASALGLRANWKWFTLVDIHCVFIGGLMRMRLVHHNGPH